ncbi:MAG: hypothetical protein IJ379_03580 [Lachnospiraceae bacterium]|nr:hypothetical protein [Lachnospiraceae bacterium]
MENTQKSTLQNMQAVADGFFNLQRKYFMNDIQDEELIEVTTQPFWQSMRLSKRRLQEKNLTMDVAIEEDGKSKEGHGRVFLRNDGTNQIGSNTEQVVTKRSFYYGGKMIYSKKDYDVSTTYLLKTEVDGEDAACPNCGHIGKVAGFIDGCDYCGSKFTVRDFEPKISGFSLEENTTKKVRSTYFKTLVLLGVVTLLLLGVSILSAILLMIFATMQQTEGVFASILSMVTSLNLLPVLKSAFRVWIVLFVVIGGFLVFATPRRIKGEIIIKTVLPDFSSQDFFQHLEYKLRNIHLTDKAKEVNAYSGFDLAPIVAGYGEVVDCHMRSLKYLAIRPTDTGYVLEVEANLKLSLFNGRRIKTKYETVKLLLSGKREILEKSTAAIREYKCPNCHGSISLLEGGICEYCNTQLDYENYSWVLQRYEKKWKLFHTYRWIQLAMIGIYILVLAICYKTSGMSENESLEYFSNWTNPEQAVFSIFDKVPRPEDLGLEVILSEETQKYEQSEQLAYRKCVYVASEPEAVTQKYCQNLIAEGLTYYEETLTNNSHTLYMEDKFVDDTGSFKMTFTNYVKVIVSYTEDEVILEYYLVEDVGK